MNVILLMVSIPIVTALLMLIDLRMRVRYLILTVSITTLSLLSLYLVLTPFTIVTFSFSPLLETLLIIADVLVLLFFVHQGVHFRSTKVVLFAIIQLLLYIFIEITLEHSLGATLILDRLSTFMFLIINIVGGVIVLYALRYMKDEAMCSFRKRLFIAYLLLFISIMNMVVMANSLLLFFFLFEMTTLASYLLIGFRKDQVSQKNALRALWMNQIGGVVILLAIIIATMQSHTIYFDTLLNSSSAYLLLVLAFLSMAAFVKAASIPFDSWLLGAMVAPTPVSAMLHSATMVKIAPFLILKIAPVMAGTLLGGLISISGALGFLVASYLALSRSLLKEILGYSTIALLGLMIALAAIGTPQSMALAMIIMFFHAFSKAILFLSAGILEKNVHVKDIEDMKGIIQCAPITVGFIMFGFISLTLPPFGLFMGKLFAIESIASILKVQPWYLIVLIAMIVGSSLLVLLYFKVASALLSKRSDVLPSKKEALSWGFHLPLFVLTFITLVLSAGYAFRDTEHTFLVGIFGGLLISLVLWSLRRMNRFDRTSVYHCGEKEGFDSALFYFSPSKRVTTAIYVGFTLLFSALVVAGVVS